VLLPRFNRELLPDKPILFHWLAAVPCAIAGFSEGAVRLPSAIAGAALVGWTAALGVQLFGAPAGLVGGALLATTPALFNRARVARPDALFVLLFSLALGLAFRWWRDGRRRDASLALACLGAATLAKGPVGPVLFALTVGGFLFWQGDLRRVRELATGPGLLALAVLGLGWYVVALAGWGETFVREHLVGRYLRNLAGGLVTGQSYSHRPLSYHLRFYFLHLPAIALPWTPLALVTLWQAWRRDRLADPRLRFLLCWVAAPVVAFTPAEWKLRYYLLPVLPAVALMAAPSVVALWRRPPRPLARPVATLAAALAVGATTVVVAALAAGRITLARSDRQTLDALLATVPGGAAVALGTLGLLAGGLTVLAASRAWRPLVALVAVVTIGWLSLGVPALEREVSRRDSLKGFARAVAARHPRPAPLVTYGAQVRPVLLYLDEPAPTLASAAAATPGLGVIAVEPAYERLGRATSLSAPLLVGEGRIGNLGRGRVMMGLVTGPPAAASSPR
jgi:4-amino-4-deoxy-L-arabinose transferase-like glycosyltransferase